MADHPRSPVDDVLRELRAGLGPDDLGPGGLRSTRPPRARPSRDLPPGDRPAGPSRGHRAPAAERRGCAGGAGRAVGLLLVVAAVVLAARVLADGGAAVPARPATHDGPAPATSATSTAATAAEAEGAKTPPGRWRRVVEQLDAERVAALGRRDSGAVREVHVAGSPALRTDVRAVVALRRAGVRAEGLRTDVVDVERVRTVSAARVLLRVTDRRSAYRLVDGSGSTVREVAAAPTRTWRVVLQRQDGEWRFAVVRPDPSR